MPDPTAPHPKRFETQITRFEWEQAFVHEAARRTGLPRTEITGEEYERRFYDEGTAPEDGVDALMRKYALRDVTEFGG